MAIQPDTLHALITSLSKEEVAGFEDTLSVYTLKDRKNLSLVLFRHLLSMADYDYDSLAQGVAKHVKKGSLSSLKSQLKRRLLAYLREKSESPMKRWHEMLEEADLLMKRGIFVEAGRMLDQVKEEAKQGDKAHYALASLYLGGYGVQRAHEADAVIRTLALGDDIERTAGEILLTARIYRYYAANVAVIFKGSLVRDEETLGMLRSLDSFAVTDEDAASGTLYQQYFYLMGRYNNARLNAEFDSMYDYAKRRLAFYEGHKDFLETHQRHSIPMVYLDFVESCLIVDQVEEWRKALGGYKAYIDEAYPLVPIYHAFYDYELYTFPIKNGDEKEIIDALDALEKSYANLDGSIVLIKKSYEMSLVGGYYKTKDYDRALAYCRKLLQEDASGQMGGDVDEIARLMRLIIQFEKLLVLRSEGDLIGFQSLVLSEYHHFRKLRGDYRLELAFIAVFRQAGDKARLNKELGQFEESVRHWLDEPVGCVKQFNMSFDLLKWLNAVRGLLEL